MLGGIAVGFLLLVVFVGGRFCNSTTCTEFYCPTDRKIEAPEGYEFASRIFAYNQDKGVVQPGTDLAITVELKEQTDDGRSLSFYRYIEETRNWEPMTPAVLEPQGRFATATFVDKPPIVSVLRRLSPGGSVVAYLPHNGVLHPDAAGRVTIAHTLDFTPAADGSVQGDLSSLKSDGSFEIFPVISANAANRGSVAIVESILTDANARSTHVQQITSRLAELNLNGVDIAYMDLPVTARLNFTLFASELYQALHAQNKQLTLTLPSPIKAQNRVDEGAYDWTELGKSADLIKVAPYRDQASYRLNMPEILQHLAERVTPSKLILTVTPYATETGGESISLLTLTQAMNIATRISVRADADSIQTATNVTVAGTNIDREEALTGVRWSPETATVAFSYKQATGAGSRTIYMENVFSVGFKLELIPTYKLGGVAIEDASNNDFLGNIWPALIPFITTGQPVLLSPNGEDLKPKWSASDGTVEDTGKGSANWFTPQTPGTYTISLTLSDGVALFENSVQVNVKARTSTGTPSASPTAAR